MIINRIKSYFIILKASSFQGRGQFEKVIELSLIALKLYPKSHPALLFLADDYPRLGKIENAKEILNSALKLFPNDWQFNYIMAEVIIKNKDAIENAIPYLKTYLKYRPKKRGVFPFYMKIVSKLFGINFNWDKYSDELNDNENSQYQWASNILQMYEKDNQSIDQTEG